MSSLNTPYSPQMFLASVGSGGVAVSFFMWLLHGLPHPGRTAPTFEDISQAFLNGSLAVQVMIAVAVLAIAFFAFENLRLLVWNLRQMSVWKQTDAYASFLSTNAQTQGMALPLALAMSVNVLFVLGLVFVPGLWSFVEWLFPVAMAVFLTIGVLAFRLYGAFLGRVLAEGGFSCKANNNFGQILPAFAFGMVGVGLAAPAAMSANMAVAGTALVLSGFFFTVSALIAGLALILGFRAMMEHGTQAETAPTLSILVPLMAVLGILVLRQQHGLSVHFGVPSTDAETMMFLVKLFSVQIAFSLFAGLLLWRHGYVGSHVLGSKVSPASYALVCPGVALSVLGQFLLHKGFVAVGLVAVFSPLYWVLMSPLLVVQAVTILLLLRLNAKHFGKPTLPSRPAVA